MQQITNRRQQSQVAEGLVSVVAQECFHTDLGMSGTLFICLFQRGDVAHLLDSASAGVAMQRQFICRREVIEFKARRSSSSTANLRAPTLGGSHAAACRPRPPDRL